MLQADKLTKTYGDRCLFGDATFHLGRRERCVIAGRNGSGKSTLLKIILGIEEADEGEIFLPKGTRIGSLPQHIVFKEGTVLEEALLGLPADERDQEYRAEIILSGLGLSEEEFYLDPQSLSGGYQLRLCLCKALVGEPDLLLLDEPTNYLDILSIRWLERFLRNWHGQLLFISHDRAFVNSVCTHVMGIKRGTIKKVKGNLNDYFAAIAIAEETHERRREKLEKKKQHMLTFVERFGAKATKATQAQSRLKAIEKMESLDALEEEQLLNFRFRYKPYRNALAFRTEGLTFAYNEATTLIDDVSSDLENGKRLAIIGKNGSGKSTLLRLLIGELTPQGGSVTMGANVATAYFGQTNIDRLNPDHTIEEELMAALPDCDYPQIRGACGAMLFSGDDAKKRIAVLSGGERSRVLLAKLLLTPANLLLLDEPTQHLDIESVQALMVAIDHFAGATVLVSHDEDALKCFRPDQLIICHDGSQERFIGDYSLFLKKRGWQEEK